MNGVSLLKVFRLFALALGLALAVAAILAVMPLNQSDLFVARSPVVFQNVNLVDVRTGQVRNGVTVSVRDGFIEAISSGDNPIPEGYRTVQAEGKYLMPGLWDMHTHGLKISPVLHHPLFIRHGVTAVREMSGCLSEPDSYWACPEDRRQWNAASLNGEMVAPRYILQSSYQTNGGNEVPNSYPDFFSLETQADAEKVVQFYEDQGADFIKTYTELSPSQFDFLVAATDSSELYLAGHKPLLTSLDAAIEGGMKSIEHGRLFMFECFDQIEAFRQEDTPIASYNANKIGEIIDNQDQAYCEQQIALMAASDTYWVPTLTTLKMSAASRDQAFRDDVRLREIASIVKTLLWDQDVNRAATRGFDQTGRFVHEPYFNMASQQVGEAHAKGVSVLVGTDNIDTYVFSGSSLHDELEMLVAAGMSNADVLRAATLSAAEFSNLENEMGSIEVGKVADLVLLENNPLEDIRHTRTIVGVMYNGHFFDQSKLAALETSVVNAASSIHVNIRYLSDLLMSPLMRMQIAD